MKGQLLQYEACTDFTWFSLPGKGTGVSTRAQMKERDKKRRHYDDYFFVLLPYPIYKILEKLVNILSLTSLLLVENFRGAHFRYLLYFMNMVKTKGKTVQKACSRCDPNWVTENK